ncbi:hypothetical protein HG530_014331 [Fusarium avenaceum]|nr:hypothetical protein HG530_014331 [Fusarium avenaceum]
MNVPARKAVLSVKLLLNLRLDLLPHGLPVVRDIRDTLGQLLKTDELLGKNLLLEVEVLLVLEGKLDGAGELGRVSCGEGDVRDVGLGALSGSESGGDTDGGVGVENVSDLLVDALDGLEGFRVADTLALEGLAGAVEDIHVDRAETSLDLEILEPSLNFLTGLFSVEFNIHSDVAGHENVHSRAESLLHTLLMSLNSIDLKTTLGLGALGGLLLVFSGLPESVKDIVLVSRDNKLVDRETHASRKVSSEDVSKVSSGDNKADLVADLEVGVLPGQGEV